MIAHHLTRDQARDIGPAALERFDHAPRVLSRLTQEWGIERLRPMPGATCSLLYEVEWSGTPAVMKYPLDPDEVEFGTPFLLALDGYGGVPILKVDGATGTLLMEKALPGAHLNEVVLDDEEAIRTMAGMIRRLRSAPDGRGYRLSGWYRELYDAYDRTGDARLGKAIETYEWLLETSPPPRLIHGDLHHYNLLNHHGDWAVIDPKGVLIDPSYEPCSFMRNPFPFISEDPQLLQKTKRRIEVFAEELGDDPRRIWGWSFAQVTLDSINEDDFAQCCLKISKALWKVGQEQGYWPLP